MKLMVSQIAATAVVDLGQPQSSVCAREAPPIEDSRVWSHAVLMVIEDDHPLYSGVRWGGGGLYHTCIDQRVFLLICLVFFRL